MNTLDAKKRGWLMGIGAVAAVVGLMVCNSGTTDHYGPVVGPNARPPVYYNPYLPGGPASANDALGSGDTDSSRSVEPYTGLTDDEKQAIWRQELPTWTQEERKHGIEGMEP